MQVDSPAVVITLAARWTVEFARQCHRRESVIGRHSCGGRVAAGRTVGNSRRRNCFAERFVLTARTELTDRMLIFGEPPPADCAGQLRQPLQRPTAAASYAHRSRITPESTSPTNGLSLDRSSEG
jgi:hypothetical protein